MTRILLPQGGLLPKKNKASDKGTHTHGFRGQAAN
jgi:hypothetical protein